MPPVAFQDRMPGNYCFGCGALNPDGLQIKSYWNGEDSVCTFEPLAAHAAGPPQFLNGGIIATLIDCHSICTAIAWSYRAEGREMGSDPVIWCVTGSIEVRYLAPTPIGGPVRLRARVVGVDERKTTLECALSSAGQQCARGAVVAIRVPGSWSGGHFDAAVSG